MTLHQRPSTLLGLKHNSYEAYCLDEAVTFFGLQLQAKLEEAGHKPSKEERKLKAAREKVIGRILGDPEKDKKQKGFADPALFM